MKLPNRERAVIAREKLTNYLLNVAHKRGGAKARLLERFGYTADRCQQLADDIRAELETLTWSAQLRTARGMRFG